VSRRLATAPVRRVGGGSTPGAHSSRSTFKQHGAPGRTTQWRHARPIPDELLGGRTLCARPCPRLRSKKGPVGSAEPLLAVPCLDSTTWRWGSHVRSVPAEPRCTVTRSANVPARLPSNRWPRRSSLRVSSWYSLPSLVHPRFLQVLSRSVTTHSLDRFSCGGWSADKVSGP